MMKKLLYLFIFAALFNACTIKDTSIDKTREFLLQSYGFNSFENSGKVLKIHAFKSPLYLNSKNIIYVEKNELSAYAHSFFADTPSNFLRAILSDKAQKSMLFRALAEDEFKADFSLSGKIMNFELVLAEENFIKISLRANLLDKNQILLAQKSFEIRQKCENLELEEIIKNYEIALNLLSDEVIFWLKGKIK